MALIKAGGEISSPLFWRMGMKFVIAVSKLAYITVDAEDIEQAELLACDIPVPDDEFDVVIEATGEVEE